MEELLCFAAVDFVNDLKVAGYPFWYLCNFRDIKEGDRVVAPLGRHNRLQEGVVLKVIFAPEDNAPYPMHSIKLIRELKKESQGV